MISVMKKVMKKVERSTQNLDIFYKTEGIPMVAERTYKKPAF